MRGGMVQPNATSVQWVGDANGSKGAPVLDDTTFEFRFRGARMQLRRAGDLDWVEFDSIDKLPQTLKKLGKKR